MMSDRIRPVVRPSLLVAFAFTAGAIMFGIVAAGCTVVGNWVALVILGFIAVCHMSSAIYYWGRYLAIREKRVKREKLEMDSCLRRNDMIE